MITPGFITPGFITPGFITPGFITPGFITPGFADPVLDGQACFRAVLDAMARPGSLHTVAAPAEPPAPLGRATAATLLTLIDAETPLWLDPAAADAAPWIAFHCGAPIVPAAQATFGLSLNPRAFNDLNPGSDEAPETGATLILQVATLGAGQTLRLDGPGLAAPTTLAVDGLPPDFIAAWAANHARFPRGVDLILCAGAQLAAFPRTLRIGPA